MANPSTGLDATVEVGKGLNDCEGDGAGSVNGKTVVEGTSEALDMHIGFLRFGRCSLVAHGTQWSLAMTRTRR